MSQIPTYLQLRTECEVANILFGAIDRIAMIRPEIEELPEFELYVSEGIIIADIVSQLKEGISLEAAQRIQKRLREQTQRSKVIFARIHDNRM